MQTRWTMSLNTKRTGSQLGCRCQGSADVAIPSTTPDDHEPSLVIVWDILLEKCKPILLGTGKGGKASEPAMLNGKGLSDVDMTLCRSLLILTAIHILSVSHKNSDTVSAAKTTVFGTFLFCSMVSTPHTSHLRSLIFLTSQQSLLWPSCLKPWPLCRLTCPASHTWLVHLDMLMHVRPLTAQGQAVADKLVRPGVSPGIIFGLCLRPAMQKLLCCISFCIKTQFPKSKLLNQSRCRRFTEQVGVLLVASSGNIVLVDHDCIYCRRHGCPGGWASCKHKYSAAYHPAAVTAVQVRGLAQ